jgi:sugar/nucleoside kinase (ribokinase family)
MGPFCEKPRLTTGAGDNFNAGYVLGLLLGLEPEEALLTGMATSGFYVRNAKSPDFAELVGFIDNWAQGNI